MASASAGSSIGISPDESLVSPKNTKKVAAKRSRSGVSTWLAFAATLPDRAMPTRNAPTAADTPTWAARPATSMVRPEHAEQQRLVLVGREQPRHDVPVPEGDVEDQRHDPDRDRDRDRALQQAHADDDRRQDRQVEGHREVLDDEHGEDRGCLTVREAAEVAEELRDHARRRDPGDAGQRHRRHRSPAEQQRERRARAGRSARASRMPAEARGLEAPEQLGRRVLEAEQGEQQDDRRSRTRSAGTPSLASSGMRPPSPNARPSSR